MNILFRPVAWRYEVRVLGPALFLIPIAIALFFASFAILMFIGHVNRDFTGSVLLASLEACLPLAIGILLATVATHDSAIELLLTLPTPYRLTAFRRFLLLLVWTILVEFVMMTVMYVFLPWALPRPFGEGLLIWLTPTFWFAGAGILIALLFHSRANSSTILGCAWIIELVAHSFVVEHPWTHPWFLFITLYVPQSGAWLLNKLFLFVVGLFFLGLAWFYLRNTERRLQGEDA